MTAEEARELRSGDTVTREGKAGIFVGFFAARCPPDVIVDWGNGERTRVPYSGLERGQAVS